MEQKLKLGYFADGPWAHRALEKILSDEGLEVAFIAPRFTSPDTTLIARAREKGIPVLVFENVNSPESIKEISRYGCDLLVSMSYNQIIRKPLFSLPRLGFINCHAGKLPFYRGRNILNWALINGEKTFGISVNYIDDGIDTGDLVCQEEFEILPEDDYASLLEKAHSECGNVLYKAICLIREDKGIRIQQQGIHLVGFYCPQRRAGDEILNWQDGSKQLHNFVRAITLPGPCARTVIRNIEVAIIKTCLIPQAPRYVCKPGEVVGRSEQGIVVKTGDTTILVTQIADVDAQGKLENFRIPRYPIGERLGLDMALEVLKLKTQIERLQNEIHFKLI